MIQPNGFNREYQPLGSHAGDLNVLFAVVPYIALTVFLSARWFATTVTSTPGKPDSSQLLESKQLRRGSIPFHIGILAIFAGHFVGLLTPNEVWHVLGFGADQTAYRHGCRWVFWPYLFLRHVYPDCAPLNQSASSRHSSSMDIGILLLLFLQLMVGLVSIFVSAGHMDGRRDAQTDELGAEYTDL